MGASDFSHFFLEPLELVLVQVLDVKTIDLCRQYEIV